MQIKILYEDAHIIVCIKPAGVPSQSDKTSDFDMVNRLKNYVYESGEQKEQPFIGVVHRLDRPVEGVMVFAKTKFAAKQLSSQIQQGQFHKRYLAVVTKELPEKLGNQKELLTDYLVKNGRTNLSSITDKENKNAKRAELYYTVKAVKEGCSLVEIELLTGRHHQIRVQMKEHLAGIWGDSKYNKESIKEKEWRQIGLASCYLEFNHPKTNKNISFEYLPQREPFNYF
ncbi:RluA family pseudouridine synthase [Velocimicrobium porci]|nr:RluA family pseudouridine synthase [Velocimicrobium porci]